jgi:hypothetical protein
MQANAPTGVGRTTHTRKHIPLLLGCLLISACAKPDFVVLKNRDGSIAIIVRRNAIRAVKGDAGPRVTVFIDWPDRPIEVPVDTTLDNIATQIQ